MDIEGHRQRTIALAFPNRLKLIWVSDKPILKFLVSLKKVIVSTKQKQLKLNALMFNKKHQGQIACSFLGANSIRHRQGQAQDMKKIY